MTMSGRDAELDEAQQAYVDQVRAAAARLGVRAEGSDPSRDALADLQEVVPLDVDPPTSSASPAGRAVKSTVKRLVRWYFSYISTQVTAIGEATVRLGSVLADRADELDSASKAHTSKIEELERRVQQLESGPRDRR